jgi:hypothetical protein
VNRIYTMYAFLAEDDEGEGIAAFLDPRTGMWMPMVGADEARVNSLRQMAKVIAKETGKPVRLFRFQVREMLEEIEP